MGDFLKSRSRHLSGGWFSFWAAVLLILPNCSFNPSSGSASPNLDPGTPPHTSAVFCDIATPVGRHCASAEEKAMGIRLASAAMALVAGQTSSIGLDESPDALNRCGGEPEAIVFQGPFPQGYSVCLNCAETILDGTYANANAVCEARCQDFFGTPLSDGSLFPDNPPTADTLAFCAANAHASTNFPLNGCFEGACSMAGMLNVDFADPRRIPEPVEWVNLVGVSAAGGTLTRTAPFTGAFDAGASSSQLITGGDGYLEFTAAETNTIRIAGLSSGPPPGSLTFNDIGFGIEPYNTGELFVTENGSPVSSFGAYTAGQKFRVKLQDNFNGTATVSYARINGPCTDGSACSETVFYTSANTIAYPVRVDAMFFEQGATVTEARIVRIR